MLITKNQGGPSKGVKLRRQKGLFTAHAAALTKGLAYPLDLTAVTSDLSFYKTKAVAAASDTVPSWYVVPEEDVASGEDFWGVMSGEVTMIAAGTVAIGDDVTVNSAGKVTGTIPTGAPILGIVKSAASADEEVTVELVNGSGVARPVA